VQACEQRGRQMTIAKSRSAWCGHALHKGTLSGVLRAIIAFGLLPMFVSVAAPTAHTYEIVQQKGVDQRVDYKSLEKYGAWDDRNYELTKEDVELLEEAFAKDNEPAGPLPAWFRVKVRREAGLAPDRRVEYRNLLNIFLQQEGGWRIGNKYYKETKLEDGRYKVITGENR
jgi:hypothetical protein